MARKIKQVYFNLVRDKELLEIAEGIDNFSDWVKKCLKAEIREPDIESLVNRLIAKKLIDTHVETKLARRIETPDQPIKADIKINFDGFL